MNTSILFQVQSFIILAMLYYGVTQRKKRSKHIKIMVSAIIWDFILVLQIELSRGAIKQASELVTAPLMLKVHLFFAIGSALLFIAMLIMGRKVIKGNNKLLPIHAKLGWTTLFFRTATLVTSYFIVASKV